MAFCMGASKIFRSFHTSITRRSFPCISAGAPLYASAVASAIMGEKAIMKSSFRRIRDCCATSVFRCFISSDSRFALERAHFTICEIDETKPSGCGRILQSLHPKRNGAISVPSTIEWISTVLPISRRRSSHTCET